MKKSLISLAVASVIATSALAEGESTSNSSIYFGVGTFSGTANHTITQTYSSGTTNEFEDDYDADGILFKIGSNSGSSRFEVSYTSMDREDETFSGLDLDWVKPFGSSNLKPYLTLGFGYAQWEDYEVIDSSGDTRERAAFTLNYGVGLLYSLGMVELDVAYKGKNYYWEDLEGTSGSTSYTLESETNFGGLYAGVNFHF